MLNKRIADHLRICRSIWRHWDFYYQPGGIRLYTGTGRMMFRTRGELEKHIARTKENIRRIGLKRSNRAYNARTLPKEG
jgi:hypothetical protein